MRRPIMRLSFQQCRRSASGAAIGSIAGIFCGWVLEYSVGWTVFNLVLGIFIGTALTLPGVSANRVFGMTAGMIVDYNTVGNLGDKVYRSIAGEDAEPKTKSERDGPYTPEDFPGPDPVPGRKQHIGDYSGWLDPVPLNDEIAFAVLAPCHSATEEDLRAIGYQLQVWQTENSFVRTIVGLEQLLEGKLPETPAEIFMLSIPPLVEYVALVHVSPEADTEETSKNLEMELVGLPIAMIVSPAYYIQINR